MCEPGASAEVVRLACPVVLLSTTTEGVPRTVLVVVSVMVTVPPGVAVPGLLVLMLSVNVTGVPTTCGEAGLAAGVTVSASLLTTTVSGLRWVSLPWKLPSPL